MEKASKHHSVDGTDERTGEGDIAILVTGRC